MWYWNTRWQIPNLKNRERPKLYFSPMFSETEKNPENSEKIMCWCWDIRNHPRKSRKLVTLAVKWFDITCIERYKQRWVESVCSIQVLFLETMCSCENNKGFFTLNIFVPKVRFMSMFWLLCHFISLISGF